MKFEKYGEVYHENKFIPKPVTVKTISREALNEARKFIADEMNKKIKENHITYFTPVDDENQDFYTSSPSHAVEIQLKYWMEELEDEIALATFEIASMGSNVDKSVIQQFKCGNLYFCSAYDLYTRVLKKALEDCRYEQTTY